MTSDSSRAVRGRRTAGPAGRLGRTAATDAVSERDSVMVYWATRTGASSARLYWERRQAPDTMVPQRPVTVPTGVANYPGELIRSLRPHAERFFNIVHWSELPRGGHFPAME